MKKYLNNQGFTLMELLIAISIFSLLITFVVVNYVSNEESRLLKLEASKILDGLQKTENMSITGQIFDSFVPSVYEFHLSNCSDNCYYVLSVKDALGNSKELENQKLNRIGINILGGNDVLFRFLPPRGRLEIIVNEIIKPSIKIDLGNNENFYCLEASSISGRISLKDGFCQ